MLAIYFEGYDWLESRIKKMKWKKERKPLPVFHLSPNYPVTLEKFKIRYTLRPHKTAV